MQCSGHANIKQIIAEWWTECTENKFHLFAFHQSTLLTKRQNNIVLGRQYHDAHSTDERSEAEGKATVLG